MQCVYVCVFVCVYSEYFNEDEKCHGFFIYLIDSSIF